MTPLAHEIAKAAFGVAGARLNGPAGGEVLVAMRNAIFVEVTEAGDAAAGMLHETQGDLTALAGRGYLPAPITWLEWRDGESRNALLLIEDERQSGPARDICAYLVNGWDRECHAIGGVFFFDNGWRLDDDFPHGTALAGRLMAMALGYLNVLNTPTLVRERIVQPHAGLARTLAQRGFMGGKFPLQGYTEITLRPGAVIAGKGRGGTSADRCLHFVRRHERRIHGVWTMIDPHWRGDASLGMRLTRYKLKPGGGL
jgi:hypothetical protein